MSRLPFRARIAALRARLAGGAVAALDEVATLELNTETLTLTLPVNEAPVASITSPAEGASFADGATIELRGAGVDAEDGALVPAWSSDVDGPLGSGDLDLVAGVHLAAGAHVITATVTDADGASDTETRAITVEAAPDLVPASLVLTPATASLAPAETQQLTATVYNAASEDITASVTVTWGSSNDAAATVSSSGLVTGVADGSATITATSGAASDTTAVTVATASGVYPTRVTLPSGWSMDSGTGEFVRDPASVWEPARDAAAPSATIVTTEAELRAAIAGGGSAIIPAGTTITLANTLELPGGTASAYQYIEVQGAVTNLPVGTRPSAADEANMATIVSPPTLNYAAIVTAPGAGYIVLRGLKITTTRSNLANLVRLGPTSFGGSADLTLDSQRAHHIVVDRCRMSVTLEQECKRICLVPARYWSILDSDFGNAYNASPDSYAIASWEGSYFGLIHNTRAEGMSQPIFFGGALPAISGAGQEDIMILQNLLEHQPEQFGTYSPKLLFEIKSGQRITLAYNHGRHVWKGGQPSGNAIGLTPYNAGGQDEYVRNVLIFGNYFEDIGAFVNMSHQSNVGRAGDVQIAHNVINGLNNPDSGGGFFAQIAAGATDPWENLWIERNSMDDPTGVGYMHSHVRLELSNTAAHNFSMTDNVLPCGEYGFKGASAFAPGAFSQFTGAVVYTGQRLTEVNGLGNYTGYDDVQEGVAAIDVFPNRASGDFTVAATHAGKGADFALVSARTAGIAAGTPTAPIEVLG